MARNSVEYDIKVDINQIKSNLNQVEANMRNLGNTTVNQTSMMQKGFAGLGTAMSGFFAVDTLVNFGRQIITARSEYEKFQSVLTTSYGSAALANKAMEMLRQTAEETPYQLNEITGAFVLLKNRGLEPSKKDLINVGDVASATGKTFEQLSQAILDANNSERWREFGIEVKTMGDKMALSFKGTTIEVERSAEGAMKAVTAFGQMDGISGSMAGQMETLGGKTSNLGDAFNNLLITLGDSKLWSDIISTWTTGINWLTGQIQSVTYLTQEDELAKEWVKSIENIPKDEVKSAYEKKIAEINSSLSDVSSKQVALRPSISGVANRIKNTYTYQAGLEEMQRLNAQVQELSSLRAILRQKMENLIPPVEPIIGILDKLDEKLKNLQSDLGKQTNEKSILFVESEIERVKGLIKEYQGLYEAKKKADLWAGKEAPGPLGEHTNYSPDGAKQDKITGFAAQNIAAAKAAQEAVDKIRQDNVTSYKRMTDSLELLEKTYQTAGAIKDKAYYKEKNKIVGDFLQEAMGSVNQLADIVGEFDQEAGQMISNLGQSMVGLFSANPLTQILSTIQLVIQLGEAFSNAVGNGVNFEKEIAAMNKTLAETAALLASLRDNNGFSYYKDAADVQKKIADKKLAAEKELAKNEKKLAKQQAALNGAGLMLGPAGLYFQKKKIADLKKLVDKDRETVKQLEADYKQAEKDFNETITQTTTVSLSDAIVEGFKRGQSESEIFANNFKTLMMNAVGEALKRKTFDKLSEEGGFYDVFNEAMSDGQLSPEETAKLDELYTKAIAYGKTLWEGATEWAKNYPDAMPDTGSSMQGTIKGITEDTGNKLEGSFNAVRISLIEQKAIAMQGYNQLVMIENNTRPISEIRDLLKGGSMTQITKLRANGR